MKNRFVDRVDHLLAAPLPEATLPELARDLNELAQLRYGVRAAFCRRLACVYVLLKDDGGYMKFLSWCQANLRSAKNEPYSPITLRNYVRFGLARDTEAVLTKVNALSLRRNNYVRNVGTALLRAVGDPARPFTPSNLRRLKLPGDVSRELNALMSAWEAAEPRARSEFLYFVTGRRLNAA